MVRVPLSILWRNLEETKGNEGIENEKSKKKQEHTEKKCPFDYCSLELYTSLILLEHFWTTHLNPSLVVCSQPHFISNKSRGICILKDGTPKLQSCKKVGLLVLPNAIKKFHIGKPLCWKWIQGGSEIAWLTRSSKLEEGEKRYWGILLLWI